MSKDSDKAKSKSGQSSNLSHLDETGGAKMVDVSGKSQSLREAWAQSVVILQNYVIEEAISFGNKKGNVFATAKIAGIIAAKNCSQIIPLTHNIPLSSVEINFFYHKEDSKIIINSYCKTSLAQTGVEMEALVAASVAALTLYDMCKAMDKNIIITNTYLTKKTGGKSLNLTNKAEPIKGLQKL